MRGTHPATPVGDRWEPVRGLTRPTFTEHPVKRASVFGLLGPRKTQHVRHAVVASGGIATVDGQGVARDEGSVVGE